MYLWPNQEKSDLNSQYIRTLMETRKTAGRLSAGAIKSITDAYENGYRKICDCPTKRTGRGIVRRCNCHDNYKASGVRDMFLSKIPLLNNIAKVTKKIRGQNGEAIPSGSGFKGPMPIETPSWLNDRPQNGKGPMQIETPSWLTPDKLRAQAKGGQVKSSIPTDTEGVVKYALEQGANLVNKLKPGYRYDPYENEFMNDPDRKKDWKEGYKAIMMGATQPIDSMEEFYWRIFRPKEREKRLEEGFQKRRIQSMEDKYEETMAELEDGDTPGEYVPANAFIYHAEEFKKYFPKQYKMIDEYYEGLNKKMKETGKKLKEVQDPKMEAWLNSKQFIDPGSRKFEFIQNRKADFLDNYGQVIKQQKKQYGVGNGLRSKY